ncbi:sialidase family protein [Chondromyces apiculatus]|uniref:BNR repeat domain protein n=1 Tax=Chondromyces apiculatus DSM 436 TaxID=1192034 RepID=A0A017TDB0_9BACT|nr:hypothetical protein [Chondromyces apiculatus]EYF06551.1 Hypothetical protein CAP_1681 [Chondromyces apiculatus DSM 436]
MPTPTLCGALRAVFALALVSFIPGCPDEPMPPAEEAAAWRAVLDEEDLQGVLLSVWAAGSGEVFAVGGPLGNGGFETQALRFDGERWQDLAPGGEETLWWVSGAGRDDVWMVGEQGRLLHWDGAAFTEHESGTSATLWGVYAFSATEAWAVGGTPGKGLDAPNDIVLRWDGDTWSAEPLPGEPLGQALYKVWGTSSEDLYVVGEGGTIWHRGAAGWVLQSNSTLASGTLFTVHGCGPTEVYAVGGQDVLRSDGEQWTKVEVALPNTVNGVACSAPGEVALVGFGGLKLRLVEGAWINEQAEDPLSDLHAVWPGPDGALWTVGGDFLTKPSQGTRRRGVVGRYGSGEVAGEVNP